MHIDFELYTLKKIEFKMKKASGNFCSVYV